MNDTQLGEITDWIPDTTDTSRYVATITPRANGTLELSVAANVATDAAGNLNTASATHNVPVDLPLAHVVNIPDAGLALSVRRELDLAEGTDITLANMRSLTQLNANGFKLPNWQRIRDLTGLDHAINLSSIHLSANKISDISVLSGLNNLSMLYLGSNDISDISALSGLNNLTRLDIGDNDISDISVLSGLDNITVLFLDRNDISDISTLPDLSGLRDVYIASNPILDLSKNRTARTRLQQTTNILTIDPFITNVTMSAPSGWQNSAFDVNIVFPSRVSGFERTEVSITGTAEATITAWNTADYITYIATITPEANSSGEVIISIAEDVATIDATNIPNTAVSKTVRVDMIPPGVSITDVPSDVQNGAFNITITLTEELSAPLLTSNVHLSGTAEATITNFYFVDRATHTLMATITPTTSGDVTISFPAGTVTDIAGNNNTAAEAQTVVVDITPPEVNSLSVPTGTQDAAFNVTITFTEEVKGFVASDVRLSGVNATVTTLSTTDNTIYTATITPTTSGQLTVRIRAGAVTDAVGNKNKKVIQKTVTVDLPNDYPVFTEGGSTTRSVYENTSRGSNIGNAVSATDADGHTLTYSLSGTNASSFRIISSTGQLRTYAALDYETKNFYSVTVNVSDGNGGSDSITVRIYVFNRNDAPMFTNGTTTSRSVVENTPHSRNIGTAISATDQDGNTLQYSLSGTNASSFRIVSTTGQLRTYAALNFEGKRSYSVTVNVSDGSGGSDSINVTINVTNVNEAPIFTEGSSTTRAVPDDTPTGRNIGNPVSATDPEGNTLRYSLSGTDSTSFTINTTTGQLRTNATMDYETKNSYSVTITASDNLLTDTISVTINVNIGPVAPVFTEGVTTTRNVNENFPSFANIGEPVSATDANGDTLTYRLSGTNASSFRIVSTTGQLRTYAALNYEFKRSYSVTITASDGTFTDTIAVTINVTNVNEAPIFREGTTATRQILEGTNSGVNIGTPVSATDPENNTLTYSKSGTDASSFTIISSTGQLQTRASLDYDTKSSYSFTMSVSDGSYTDTISVTINVITTNNSPVFTDGESTTRVCWEGEDPGTGFGDPVSATDADNDTLTYGLEDYTLDTDDHASKFRIDSTTGQLRVLKEEDPDEGYEESDYDAGKTYTIVVTVSDGRGGTDSITVTINVAAMTSDGNNLPVFTDGESTSLTTWANEAPGLSFGDPISATDADNDTLTYTLSNTADNEEDHASLFRIDSTTGRLRVPKDGYSDDNVYYEDEDEGYVGSDYDAGKTYTIVVTVSDSRGGTDSITVTINLVATIPAPSAQTSPTQTTLLSNFPNPFNPETWIPYQLAKPAKVSLTIFNMRGIVVREITLGYQAAGIYRSRARAIHWDGRNEIGERVASGVYFYMLKAGDYTATRKMLMRK